MRIACIGARGIPASYSGIERACENLYAGLVERGHQVTMYCRREYVAAAGHRYRGIDLRAMPAVRRRALETVSHSGCSVLHALSADRFDVVHLHALAPNLFARLCRLRGVPVVATVQGLDWQRAKWRGLGAALLKRAERSMVANADEIIVVSQSLREYFAEQYGRTTHYIPNGMDLSDAAAPTDDTVLRQHGLSGGRYVLFLARLVPEKRVHDLITAFRAVDTPFRLAITGASSHTDDYVQLLRRLAADDPRVVFTGLQQHAAVRALFRHAAVYVLPSEMEGLPVSLLECIAEGTPAVVSDIAPHREVFAGVEGFDGFVRPADVEGLAAAIRRVLAAPTRYRAVAAAALVRARREYDWPTIVERSERLLFDVVAHPRRSLGAVKERAA